MVIIIFYYDEHILFHKVLFEIIYKKADEIHDYFIKLEETLIKIEAFIFKNKVIYNYNGRNYKYKCKYCKFD